MDEQFTGAVRQDLLTGQYGGSGVLTGKYNSGVDLFATPGLVLVGAFAIFEGYQWLQFPSGPLWPVSLLIALAVVPATFSLTHAAAVPNWSWVRRVARASAMFVLVLGIVVTIDRALPLTRALGVFSLVLSGSVLSLAVASEYRRGRAVPID